MRSKRFKYLLASLFSALGFWFFISLPYESMYYGLMAGIVLVVFCFWFGLGIVFDKSLYKRLMTALLPVGFYIGFGMFCAFLPLNWIYRLLLSGFFGMVFYTLFLVENVFLVAIGYKTVPLYRAAYTVSLIILLLTAFFIFDSILSFRQMFWVNGLAVGLASLLMFWYQYWAITIELPDDGEKISIRPYLLVPSLILTELAVAFSFWPTGIFKGSVYLVSAIYILSGLIQADIRERLFAKVWQMYLWVGIAVLSAVMVATRWR